MKRNKSRYTNTFTLIRSKGFTLIELLVGITIASIAFSVGYAGFREFSRRQALTGVTKMVVSDLRQIQQYALTGQKPSTGVCTKLVGYTFSRYDQDTYQIIANCDNGGTMVTITTKTIDLNGITFTATTPNTMFKVLGQGTNLTTINTFMFTHVATNTTALVTVGIGGEVQ